MNRLNLILLWILVFLGFVFDLLSGSKTFVNYGFIGFNLLLLLSVGIQSLFKESKLIKLSLMITSFLILLSAVVIFVLGLILNIESFGLGIIVYGLFTAGIASSLTTLIFILIKPIITKKENIGKRDLLIFLYLLVFIFTHRLVVPNNTEVPFLTYLVSIIVICLLLAVFQYLFKKFLKLNRHYYLSITILLLIAVSHLGFGIQVIFLWPLQIYNIVLLANIVFKSSMVKEFLFGDSKKLGV